MDLSQSICAEIQANLPLYVVFLNRGRDCSIPPEIEQIVEDHLAVCSMCAIAFRGKIFEGDIWAKQWDDSTKEVA